MGPTVAFFYILCPIPGTEQYDDFRARGLIDEDNLDRFDGTCLTWRHPCLARSQASRLLFRCYHRFFSWGYMFRNAAHRTFRGASGLAEAAKNVGLSLFSRYCAWRQMHPMSGGVIRVRRDGVNDFIALRKETFGFESDPLPRSLQLSAADGQFGGVTRPRVRVSRPQAVV